MDGEPASKPPDCAENALASPRRGERVLVRPEVRRCALDRLGAQSADHWACRPEILGMVIAAASDEDLLMSFRAILACLAVVLLSGCGPVHSVLGTGVKLESPVVSATPPGQVAVHLTASTSEGPLDNLNSSDFAIYEDGTLVGASESRQTLLDPDLVTSFHTVLLLDLGGNQQPAEREALSRATATFVDHVRPTQPVSVFAFDGSSTPQLLAEFPQQQPAVPVGSVPEVVAYQVRDSSRDLRTNTLEGLKQLNARLTEAPKPIRAGTLVVFTQGPDLAGRMEEEMFYRYVNATNSAVVAISLGEPANEVEQLGTDGLVQLGNILNAGVAFDDAASRVVAIKQGHYLLSYCSPARSGRRLLRIEANAIDSEGYERKGHIELEFDSTAFGPGCDAKRPPIFAASAPPQPVESPTAEPAPAAAPSAEPPPPAAPSTELPPPPPPAEPAPTSGESGSTGIVPPPNQPGYMQ